MTESPERFVEDRAGLVGNVEVASGGSDDRRITLGTERSYLAYLDPWNPRPTTTALRVVSAAIGALARSAGGLRRPPPFVSTPYSRRSFRRRIPTRHYRRFSSRPTEPPESGSSSRNLDMSNPNTSEFFGSYPFLSLMARLTRSNRSSRSPLNVMWMGKSPRSSDEFRDVAGSSSADPPFDSSVIAWSVARRSSRGHSHIGRCVVTCTPGAPLDTEPSDSAVRPTT